MQEDDAITISWAVLLFCTGLILKAIEFPELAYIALFIVFFGILTVSLLYVLIFSGGVTNGT